MPAWDGQAWYLFLKGGRIECSNIVVDDDKRISQAITMRKCFEQEWIIILSNVTSGTT